MDFRQLVKRVISPAPVITVCAIILFVLSFLIASSLGDDDISGQAQYWITLLGAIGISVLVFFLLTNIYALVRQVLKDELGSKLTLKVVSIFLLLMLIPFSLIYYFSIQFLNKGIDSWFDVRIEQMVNDSFLLSENALSGVQEEMKGDIEDYAKNLRQNVPANELLQTLTEIRGVESYDEVTLFGDDGRILAFSTSDQERIFPDTPGDEVFTELRLNQTYTWLERLSDTNWQLRVVAPIRVGEFGREFYGLQAIKRLPLRYATLANSVETARNQYAQMVFARGPLKFSLFITLSLISLTSLLFSMLAAVYLSRRLVLPISNLAAGTQRIAEGNYGSQLPITSSDELGILTKSFNNMSTKIQSAQDDVVASQSESEQQKAYLEAVLTNLSSGVFSFDQNRTLRICNAAANEILGLNREDLLGSTLVELAAHNEQTHSFFKSIEHGIENVCSNWQDEVTLLGLHGRQILILRGSKLSRDSDLYNLLGAGDQSHLDNYVVVFDDVTNLIQAQRDAAWGEVARRLAHEIKNPLTPIQLSAERIRNKLRQEVDGDLHNMLDRTTRTIVQQVESMKDMVNAFSSYAQPVRASLAPIDLNQLIVDVIELHTTNIQGIDLELDLQSKLPQIKANSGALRQVLNNLVINACHALQDQDRPKLQIHSGEAEGVSGAYVDVIVADNGSGIPSDIRNSIFDPYVSSKAKGSGLGLAIVKRIVEEHSGTVWVRDSKLGGTAMHIRLPINADMTYRGNRQQNGLQ